MYKAIPTFVVLLIQSITRSGSFSFRFPYGVEDFTISIQFLFTERSSFIARIDCRISYQFLFLFNLELFRKMDNS